MQQTQQTVERNFIRKSSVLGTALISIICFSTVVRAADWPTFGHDPQRSGWASEETTLTPENVNGLELKWKTQVDNIPLALNALMPPVVAAHVQTSQGIKTLVYAAGSSDTFFALDAQDGKLYGLDLGSGETKFGPFQFVPAFAKAWSLNFNDEVVYTSTSQGCGGDRSGIYAMDVRDPMHPVSHELLIRRGHGGGMWGRGGPVIGRNRLLYTSAGDGNFDPAVGDYGSTFLAVSLKDLNAVDYYAPRNWEEINKYDLDMPSGGYSWFSFKDYNLVAGGGKESVVYLLDANSLGSQDHHTPLYITPRLGNDQKELDQKGMWGAPSVGTDKQGQLWLYVTLWGPLSKDVPKFPKTNGLVPHGCIMAFRVDLDGGTHKPVLVPAWTSPDFNLPDPPVIANGVLFALSTGENPQQQHVQGLVHYKSVEDWKRNLLTTEERGSGTRPAVLFALDAKTGKLLYQSGDSMKSWVHFSGLAVAEGHVFTVDYSSRVYCFGLRSEQR